MTREPTTKDEYTVVTLFSQCKTFSQVERAVPHLNNYQIAKIHDTNGGNRIAALRFAAARLKRILDEQGTPPAPEPTVPAHTPLPDPPREPDPEPVVDEPAPIETSTLSIDDLLASAITALQAARRALAANKTTMQISEPAPTQKPPKPNANAGKTPTHAVEQAEFLDRYQLTIRDVRDWATDNQIPCPAAGRFLPRTVIAAYTTAHPLPVDATP